MQAWICPKCGRVWGPVVAECVPCNFFTFQGTSTTGWIPPIKRATIEMKR